jgi:hypothetical protein
MNNESREDGGLAAARSSVPRLLPLLVRSAGNRAGTAPEGRSAATALHQECTPGGFPPTSAVRGQRATGAL